MYHKTQLGMTAARDGGIDFLYVHCTHLALFNPSTPERPKITTTKQPLNHIHILYTHTCTHMHITCTWPNAKNHFRYTVPPGSAPPRRWPKKTRAAIVVGRRQASSHQDNFRQNQIPPFGRQHVHRNLQGFRRAVQSGRRDLLCFHLQPCHQRRRYRAEVKYYLTFKPMHLMALLVIFVFTHGLLVVVVAVAVVASPCFARL